MAQLAHAHQPKMIIAGFSAFSGTINWARFRAIADEVGAYLLADIAHVSGLIVAGLYPSPIGYAHVVTSTTHKTLRGPRGGLILAGDDEALHKKLNFGVFPCVQGGPLMHSIAGKAVAFREASMPAFKQYQQRVIDNAQAMAQYFIESGFDVVSKGTSNHMFLLDFSSKDFSGKQVEQWLEAVQITANKNTVPNDQRSPFQTSGLRIGTPALTSRGMGVDQMLKIAELICQRLRSPEDEVTATQCRTEVAALCAEHPIPTSYLE